MPALVEDKLRALLAESAEAALRRAVHEALLEAHEMMLTKLHPGNRSGAGEATEDGEELAEDEFGFLVSEGGFKGAGAASGMGVADMSRALDQLLQEFVISKAAEEVFPALELKIEELRLPNLIEGKVRTLIFDEAEGVLRADVHAKTAEAFAALAKKVTPDGVHVAADAVPPELEMDSYGFLLSEGGYESFKGGRGPSGLHSTDMRRGLSQLMQEFVVPKVKKVVFPLLESKVKGLGIPPIGGVQEKVLAVVGAVAEGEVRKQLHAMVLAAYGAVAEELAPPAGAAVAPEDVAPQVPPAIFSQGKQSSEQAISSRVL
jgi:hypothetical protein